MPKPLGFRRFRAIFTIVPFIDIISDIFILSIEKRSYEYKPWAFRSNFRFIAWKLCLVQTKNLEQMPGQEKKKGKETMSKETFIADKSRRDMTGRKNVMSEKEKKPRKVFTFLGKRYSVMAKTSEELAVKVALKKRDLEEGRTKIERTMLAKDWAKEYIETYRRPSLGNDAYKAMKGNVKNRIDPVIGNMMMKDIKPIHCQRIMNGLEGKSFSLVNKMHMFLKGMFEIALDNGVILENPAKRLIPPKAEAGTHRPLTDKERAVLLKVCDTHKYGLWALVMLYCGSRPGETARMIGKHVDLKEMTLYIDGTKSRAAKRHVPIPKILAERLKDAASKPFEFVFMNKNGRPISKTSRRRMWAAIIKAMNVEMGCKTFRGAVIPPFAVTDDLKPYCLRHTYATDLQSAGVPINVAKVFLGHEDISTTGNIYTHESRAAFKDSCGKIDSYLAESDAHCAAICANESETR